MFEQDRLLGFIATLLDGSTAVAYHIGFDRASAATHPLYLRLLHSSIAYAIGLGATALSFGRTVLDPKARLGAKPQAMAVACWAWCRMTTRRSAIRSRRRGWPRTRD